jgi:2',3'-cyclic-nucleotide 2'-phosphodiesterase (5'-nucleotidase family)
MINQAYRYNTYLGKVVLGFRPTAEGGWELVSRAGNYKAVVTKDPITAEDAAVKAIVDPYNALLAAYNATILGDTLHPIDALTADIEETSGGNLQADAAVAKLESEDIEVDVHLSGAMTNKMVAGAATPASPVTLTISDMFTLMPYENSLVVLSMNGPQIKTVLERGYRNYYYYKYFAPDYGGYSHYTTCLLDTNSVGKITYVDTYPVLPSGNNVVSFTIGGVPVDFTDAAKFYNVSTVNYLAAGSCNFNDGGVSLWPLDQIVQDTQFYVRDSVIEYIQAQTDPIDYVVGDPGLRLIYNILDSMSFMPFMFK